MSIEKEEGRFERRAEENGKGSESTIVQRRGRKPQSASPIKTK
jgi:hypothetical protein